jgi:hypothetical protein
MELRCRPCDNSAMDDFKELYQASVTARNPDGSWHIMLYVVLAASPTEALAAVEQEVPPGSSVELIPHDLPVQKTVERLGLEDCRAKPLA